MQCLWESPILQPLNLPSWGRQFCTWFWPCHVLLHEVCHVRSPAMCQIEHMRAVLSSCKQDLSHSCMVTITWRAYWYIQHNPPGTIDNTPGRAVLPIAFWTALTAASCIMHCYVCLACSPKGSTAISQLLTVASWPCWSTPYPRLTASSLLKPLGVRSFAPCVLLVAICNSTRSWSCRHRMPVEWNRAQAMHSMQHATSHTKKQE